MTETQIDLLVQQLQANRTLPDDDLKRLIETATAGSALYRAADAVRRAVYDTDVYLRGLIEISNYCKNRCLYCGIRAHEAGEPDNLTRYRLDEHTILDTCRAVYDAGLRTIVLQGGEDTYFTDARVCAIVAGIKSRYPDCAVTLSLGEKPYASYKAYRAAGADRYLLRHETADESHYAAMHPALRLETRMACLWHLKELGYQVGAGFMVGTPFQTVDCLVKDLRFLQQLQPDMVGIGPFMPQADTPFGRYPAGDFATCLRMIALTRLMLPHALIPATTALCSLAPDGRERGLKAGANVVMPNFTPETARLWYRLYDKKCDACTSGALEGLTLLSATIAAAGYRMVLSIGHVRR